MIYTEQHNKVMRLLSHGRLRADELAKQLDIDYDYSLALLRDLEDAVIVQKFSPLLWGLTQTGWDVVRSGE